MKAACILALLVGVCAIVCPARGAEQVFLNGTDWKGGYVLVPESTLPVGQKYRVLVDVHGAGGLRSDRAGRGWMEMLDPEPVLVLVPSFKDGFQAGDGPYARQLIDHFQWVAKRYPVHGKMFIHGHSGGAQFAHRFTMNEPRYVFGVSAHSAGSWACSGGYGSINTRAKRIPFVISCGEKDTAKAVPGYRHHRLDWYRAFATELDKRGFVFYGTTWPDRGHRVPATLYATQVRECFLLGAKGEKPESDGWKNLP